MLSLFQFAVLIKFVIIFAHAQAQQPSSPAQFQPTPPLIPVRSSPPMLATIGHDNNNRNNNNNNNNNVLNTDHINHGSPVRQPVPVLTEPQITNTLPTSPPPLIQSPRPTVAQFSSPEFLPSTNSFIPPSSIITIDVSQPPTSAPNLPTNPATVLDESSPAFEEFMPNTPTPTQRSANISQPREVFDVLRPTSAPTNLTTNMRVDRLTSVATADSTTNPSSPATEASITITTATVAPQPTRIPGRISNMSSRGPDSSRRLTDSPPLSSTSSNQVQFLKPKMKFKCLQESDCLNGAICRNGTCFCPPGYTGETCAINIDECRQAEEPCLNNGQCIDEINTFRCECAPGFKGDRCQEAVDMCIGSPCLNGARCVNHRVDYTCECEPGWEGKDCEKNIDECLKNPCQNNASCIDRINDYKCECGSSGFTGKNCDVDFDDCSTKPCGVGSKECVDLTGDFKCICHEGFTGKRCEIDIDECQPNPCENNGTCKEKSADVHHLHNLTTLSDLTVYQEVRDQNISSNINMSQYAGYTCECKEEYHGDRCEERKKCYTKSVHELCNHQQAECVNVGNSYECLISASFDGSGSSFATYKVIGEFKMREIHVRYRSLTGGIIMSFDTTNSDSPSLQLNKSGVYLSGQPLKRDQHIDFVELLDGTEREISLRLDVPTEIKGITVAPNEYNLPFKGCLMQVRLNNQLVPLLDYESGTNHSFEISQNNLEVGQCRTCFEKDCLNHGHCGEMGYDHCACPDTFQGDFCEIDVNECAKNYNLCLNGATCENLHGGYRCNCKEGYRGEKCQDISDYCKAKQPCMNNGVCKNIPPAQGNYECKCPSAYIGKRCDRKRDCTNECHNHHAQCVNNSTCACLPGRREERTMCEYISSCNQLEGELCLNGGTCKDLETGGYQCVCQEPYYGHICQFLTEKPQLDVILLIVVTCVGFLMAACAVVSLVIFRSVRKARATRGTYSPSTQEKFGNSASDLLKPPEPELLI